MNVNAASGLCRGTLTSSKAVTGRVSGLVLYGAYTGKLGIGPFCDMPGMFGNLEEICVYVVLRIFASDNQENILDERVCNLV